MKINTRQNLLVRTLILGAGFMLPGCVTTAARSADRDSVLSRYEADAKSCSDELKISREASEVRGGGDAAVDVKVRKAMRQLIRAFEKSRKLDPEIVAGIMKSGIVTTSTEERVPCDIMRSRFGDARDLKVWTRGGAEDLSPADRAFSTVQLVEVLPDGRLQIARYVRPREIMAELVEVDPLFTWETWGLKSPGEVQ